jgi:WhiB family transcriptional regulator, redox-sensing transcriptional regulator
MREPVATVRLPCVTSAISSRPASRNEFWSWQVRGACRTVGPSLFYSPEGERGSRKRRRESAAKAICATCEVAEVCAAYALAWREPYGTWGGLSEADREARYRTLDPAQANADYGRALAAWQRRAGAAAGPAGPRDGGRNIFVNVPHLGRELR